MTPTQATHRRLADDADARALTAHHPAASASYRRMAQRHRLEALVSAYREDDAR